MINFWLGMRHFHVIESFDSKPLFSRDFELDKIRELPCNFRTLHVKSAFQSEFILMTRK